MAIKSYVAGGSLSNEDSFKTHCQTVIFKFPYNLIPFSQSLNLLTPEI